MGEDLITFIAPTGTVHVQAATDIQGGWTNVVADLVSLGLDQIVTNLVPSASNRFYRVVQ